MKRRHIWHIVTLIALALLMIGAIIYTCLVFFYRNSLESRRESLMGVARVCAEIIDGDSVDKWIADGSDEDYEFQGKALQDVISKTPYMEALGVYKFSPEGYVIVYDYYAGEKITAGDELGTAYGVNEALSRDIGRLVEGEEVIDSDVVVNGYRSVYAPVYDSNGNYVAHIGVEFSENAIRTKVYTIMRNVVIIAAIFLVWCILVGLRIYIRLRRNDELEEKLVRAQNEKRLFEETALALANAIDAKDKYTHGHSLRVAEYSRKIAEVAGKSEEECEKVYFAGLLHDVGKIGVPEKIITKEGRLSNDEYEEIKRHSAKGSDILHDITEYPYLSIAAHHHHERYDGKGYPDKLVGTDIPDIARIIAVADAYDAMTSVRSYRKTIPQSKVREEFVACSGTQFDPQYANIMLQLIDQDTNYSMKEKSVGNPTIKDELVVSARREVVSRGIFVMPCAVTIEVKVRPDMVGAKAKPLLVLFDSLDGRYHDDPKEITDLAYFEYCELSYDGKAVVEGARDIETKISEPIEPRPLTGHYRIEAVRVDDHALIRITGNDKSCEYIIALPDCSRYSYLGFTGEHCIISDMALDRSEEEAIPGDIPRIAEMISYIDSPAGDVPNVQVDRYRSGTSEGFKVEDGMKLEFHTKSLPTARLVWHCPFCVIYSSDDGKVDGANYVEYALIRLDGENWRSGEAADNELKVVREDFEGWDKWRKVNKEGYDVSILFERKDNRIITRTENAHIRIKNATIVKDKNAEVYVALTGDQCALTNIRIVK